MSRWNVAIKLLFFYPNRRHICVVGGRLLSCVLCTRTLSAVYETSKLWGMLQRNSVHKFAPPPTTIHIH